MADSQARIISYQETIPVADQPKKIVVSAKDVPWSGFEKAFSLICSVVTLVLMVLVVSASVSVTEAEHNLSNLEQGAVTQQTKRANLQQKIGELTSPSRMTKIAKEQGLNTSQGNVRNVR